LVRSSSHDPSILSPQLTPSFFPYRLLSSPRLSSTLPFQPAGHEIVATIAQIHLTPTTASAIASILPPSTDGQLAPVAAWADSIRFSHRDTGVLHYVNPLQDDPAGHCTFGEEGWATDRNVLKSLNNYTQRVMDGEG
jgi:hypothetical protein